MFRPLDIYGEPYVDPRQPVLRVEPLRSVPYMSPSFVTPVRPVPSKNNDGTATGSRLFDESYVDSLQPVLQVEPLRTVRYMGPSLIPPVRPVPSMNKNDGPTTVFMPSGLYENDERTIFSAGGGGVILTGSAALGKVGRLIGSVQIDESEDAYIFHVSLPGVSPDKNQFSFEIEPSGKLLIKGITTTGEERVCKYSEVFEMQTQNLCSPGFFSVTFKLPGPVDVNHQTGSFSDGMLVGKIKKRVVDV